MGDGKPCWCGHARALHLVFVTKSACEVNGCECIQFGEIAPKPSPEERRTWTLEQIEAAHMAAQKLWYGRIVAAAWADIERALTGEET